MSEFIATGMAEVDYIGVLKGILKNCNSARIAIAYWGVGAIKKLGLEGHEEKYYNNIKILCCIESGACNPYEVLKLLKLGFDVKSHQKLHAKTIISEGRLVVGSANASANGLGHEENELAGTVEAALLTSEPNTVEEASNWFDNLWKSKICWEVSENDPRFKLARKRWKRRQHNRPWTREMNHATKLRNRGIWIECGENVDRTPAADKILEKAKEKVGIDNLDSKETTKFRENPQYIINIESSEGSIEYDFILKTLEDAPASKTIEEFWSYVGVVVKNSDDFFGLNVQNFLRSNRNNIIRYAKEHNKDRFRIESFLDKFPVLE